MLVFQDMGVDPVDLVRSMAVDRHGVVRTVRLQDRDRESVIVRCQIW